MEYLLQQTDLGLNPRNVLTADLLLSKRYADPARGDAFVRDVLDSIATLPGVENVAVQSQSPFQGAGGRETFTIEGQADPGTRNGHAAYWNRVGGDFFRALGISIVRGRDFDGRDTATSPPVALVNETMARRFWPNEAPTASGFGSTTTRTRIGVGIGVAGSLALTRIITGFLHGVTATDAPTFVAVLVLFAGVAFLSTYVPARRAARIDPTVAFRYE